MKYIVMISVLLLIYKYYNSTFIVTPMLNFKTREFTLKKNNHKIVLLGTSHIAEKQFYDKIKDNKDYKDLLLLAEGVQNTKTNMGNYNFFSELFGLKCQKVKLIESDNIIHADIQFDDFSVECRSHLKKMFKVLKGFETRNIDLIVDNFETNQSKNNFKYEILNKRNENLLSIIKQNSDKNLLIPWGALHIKYLKDKLKKEGYVVVKRKTFKILNIGTVLKNCCHFYLNNKEFLTKVYIAIKEKYQK